jgi:hypothetical protein
VNLKRCGEGHPNFAVARRGNLREAATAHDTARPPEQPPAEPPELFSSAQWFDLETGDRHCDRFWVPLAVQVDIAVV